MEISKIKIGRSVYDIRDKNAIGLSDLTGAINQAVYGQDTKPAGAYNITSVNIATAILNSGVIGPDNDTKNTTGSTNKSGSKLFLVGASSQDANPVTYSNSACYIGSDNYLYTNGKKAVNSQDVTDAINTELYNNSTKPNGAYTITNQNIENILQQFGVGGDVIYSNVGYAVSYINGSGSLTIPGTDPVYVVTVSSNISSVSLQSNPTFGHSCHVFFKSSDSSTKTVTISNHNTNRICPDANKGVVLTIPAANSGYVEVDFLNAGNSTTGDQIYVRGI